MKNKWFFIIPILLFAVDRLTKYFSLLKLPSEGVFLLNNHWFEFGFQSRINKFIALSLPVANWLAIILVIILCAFLICWCWRLIKRQQLYKLALLLTVLLSAISNLFDRIYYGGVVDFISWSIDSVVGSVFNFADIFIIGALILFYWQEIKNNKKL